MSSLINVLESMQWTIVDSQDQPSRNATYGPADVLPLAAGARRLVTTIPGGLYSHQADAIAAYARGGHVCVTTSTASGKTLTFQAAALDLLERHPDARVAVFYPLRALATQQEERWREAVATAAIPIEVVRIDGSIPMTSRLALLRRARIVLFTPDVFHAWVLSSTREPAVRRFLAGLRLVIVDEAHSYSGVFGSHAAFLFRRLAQAASFARGASALQWIFASATMADPQGHVRRLCGVDAELIGPDRDGSPRHPMTVVLAYPPAQADVNTSLVNLFRRLAEMDRSRFLAFIDSRRQVEALAAIFRRHQALEVADEEEALSDAPSSDIPQVLPYRSGYEEQDRLQIQEWLQIGRLRGVVSTSALELGIDIGHLDVGVQVGVPRSVTSLWQRLGRIGRAGPGQFLVVLGDTPPDRLVARQPSKLLDRVLPDTTVYLDNRRIQYIHAMCLAGPGGEGETLGGENWTFAEAIQDTIPTDFVTLCDQERTGQVPPELQALKTDGGGDPWHAFPLRDTGIGFKVELRALGGAHREPKGSVTWAQMMREAYPGAVHYYMAQPYRVRALYLTQRLLVIGREKYYTTKPLLVPPMIFPNLAQGWLDGDAHGELVAGEVNMLVTESVQGWQEMRGQQRTEYRYPRPYWNRDALRRNFFTTGVCLWHPVIDQASPAVVACAAEALYEAFLVEVPTEVGEVEFGVGRLRNGHSGLVGSRFIAIYDNTYGSLRLTARLFSGDAFARCLATSVAILRNGVLDEGSEAAPDRDATGVYSFEVGTMRQAQALLEVLIAERSHARRPLPGLQPPAASATSRPTVILPGQTGLLTSGAEEEFEVDRVFMTSNGLMYRGHRVGEAPSDVATLFPVDRVRPIPGVTQVGQWIDEFGEVQPFAEDADDVSAVEGTPTT